MIGQTGLTYKGYFDMGADRSEALVVKNGLLYVGSSDTASDTANDKLRIYDITQWPDGTGEWDETNYAVATPYLGTAHADFTDILVADDSTIYANDN